MPAFDTIQLVVLGGICGAFLVFGVVLLAVSIYAGGDPQPAPQPAPRTITPARRSKAPVTH